MRGKCGVKGVEGANILYGHIVESPFPTWNTYSTILSWSPHPGSFDWGSTVKGYLETTVYSTEAPLLERKVLSKTPGRAQGSSSAVFLYILHRILTFLWHYKNCTEFPAMYVHVQTVIFTCMHGKMNMSNELAKIFQSASGEIYMGKNQRVQYEKAPSSCAY
jgi:hypothetical protein